MRKSLVLCAVLALTFAACGGGDTGGGEPGGTEAPASTGDAVVGEQIFSETCASCHGPDARGLEGLGPDLHGNQFVAGMSDDELVEFLKVGRSADDPANTTGVAMPPKGGNPSLSDADLLDVVAYLRTLE